MCLGLKEEILNTNSLQNISFNELPLLLDLDDSFMGFDSVTISKSVVINIYKII